MAFYKDLWTGTAGTAVSAHTSDSGATYTATVIGDLALDGSGHIAGNGASGAVTTTQVPATDSANYAVSFPVILHSSADGDTGGWLARVAAALALFNSIGVKQASGAIAFSLSDNAGSPFGAGAIALSPPSFPTTYTTTIITSNSDVFALISGGELTGTKAIYGYGNAVTNVNTAHGPIVSAGTSSAHYQVGAANGVKFYPVSTANLASFGVSQRMFDTTTANWLDNLLPGGDIDMNFTLTQSGVISLLCDVVAVTGSVFVALEVDGAYVNTTQVTAGSPLVSTGTLAAGTHRVRWINAGSNTMSGSRWVRGSGSATWRSLGVMMPEGTTVGTSSASTSEILFLGDSLMEAYDSFTGVTNNYFGWTQKFAASKNLKVTGTQIGGLGCAIAGTQYAVGLITPGTSDGSLDGWSHVHSTLSRDFSTTAPAVIFIAVGTNEWAYSANTTGHATPTSTTATDANFTTNLGILLARIRAKTGLATVPIQLMVPFGGYKRQAIINAYNAASGTDPNLHLYDVAFGSVNLTTTGGSGVNEVTFYSGLTKNRPDDSDTIASAQAMDRTHPGAAGYTTEATIKLNRFASGYGNVAPASTFAAGTVTISGTGGSLTAVGGRAIGGSAIYSSQFQVSTNNGSTWTNLGSAIANQASTISPFITTSTTGVANGTYIRQQQTDQEDTPVTVSSAFVVYGVTTPPTDTPTISFAYSSTGIVVTPLAATVSGETVHLTRNGTPVTLTSGSYTDTTALPATPPTYGAYYSNSTGNGPVKTAQAFTGGGGINFSLSLSL